MVASTLLLCLASGGGRVVAEESVVPLRVVRKPKTISILAGPRPVLVYQLAPAPYKPYVKQLRTPGGVNVLRDAPSDHLHHHGLMFAVAVDGVDFWGERARSQPGTQQHCGANVLALASRDGKPVAGFSQRLDWLAPGRGAVLADGKTLLKERRTIEVSTSPADSGRPTLVTWRTRLQTPPGATSATLSGAHYFGLGMRFVSSMDKTGRLIADESKDERVVRRDERVKQARWVAYTAPVEGKPVTVALFDPPSNPRHPAGLFMMTQPFAYLSATLDLDRRPLVLSSGKALDLCWGVAVWDGRREADAVGRAYRDWVEQTGGNKPTADR